MFSFFDCREKKRIATVWSELAMENPTGLEGYQGDEKCLHPTSKKFKAVLNFHNTKNVQELQSFLGLVTYYIKFIDNLSPVCAPLNCLICRGQCFQWSEECSFAFEQLEQKLASTMVLVYIIILSCP